MTVQIFMGHGLSECFGTTLVPIRAQTYDISETQTNQIVTFLAASPTSYGGANCETSYELGYCQCLLRVHVASVRSVKAAHPTTLPTSIPAGCPDFNPKEYHLGRPRPFYRALSAGYPAAVSAAARDAFVKMEGRSISKRPHVQDKVWTMKSMRGVTKGQRQGAFGTLHRFDFSVPARSKENNHEEGSHYAAPYCLNQACRRFHPSCACSFR